MTFGQQNSEAEGHAQMDYALAPLILRSSTPPSYIPSRPSLKPKDALKPSSVLGLTLRKAPDKVLIATKAIGRSKMKLLRKDGPPGRQSRAQLIEALDGSLKRF